MTFPSLLRRISPPVLLALAIGAGAVVLNVLLARQLVQIEANARALVGTWIARASAVASFEDGIREFRRHEALYAVSPPGRDQQAHAVSLDSLRQQNDSALRLLQQLDRRTADSTTTSALRTQWAAYHVLHVADLPLPTGEESAALQRFRDREPLFRGLITQARMTEQAMRDGAKGIAMRSARSTRASQGLMIARLLLVLAAIGFAEMVRRSWKERAAAEQRWRDVADQSVGVVWEVGPSGRVRFCSRSGFELLGRDAAQVVSHRALRFIHPADRPAARRAVTEATPMHAPLRDLELRIVRPDGGVRWMAISAQPLRTADGRHDGFRGLAVDVTRRAQAEKALAQGRRMEAVGTLAGGVAHDLNNVLAAVSGYAQLMQAELPTQHPAQADLAAITSAADRGAGLVRRVLQFARQRPTEPQPVEVAEMVHEVAQLLRPQLPPHVQIALQLPDSGTYMLADPTELHQVIVNIAANAILAMRDTGTTLGFQLTSTPQHVTLTVTDDGEGMPPDVLERAIEPFFTTRDVGEGTGMGLAVAHGVVTSLGGTLEIESAPGRGTTVRVTLRRASAEVASGPVTVTAGEVQTGVRVMVVDDDPHVRNSVTRVLERAGHSVESFAAAPAALAALRADPARADVVLSDLTMPGMNGMEFATLVRDIEDAPPFVLSSGYLDLASTERARAVGVAALLDKPVDSVQLLQTITDTAGQARRR